MKREGRRIEAWFDNGEYGEDPLRLMEPVIFVIHVDQWPNKNILLLFFFVLERIIY